MKHNNNNYFNFIIILLILLIFSFIFLYKFNLIESFSNDIPIYVISLEEKIERKKYISNLLKDIKFTYFDAVNGKAINNEDMIIKNQFVSHNYEDTHSKGQLGCLLSHLKLLIQLKNSNLDMYFILEDDIIFRKDFKMNNVLDIIKKIKNIENYDFIFLGHCFEKEGKIIDKITYNNTTHNICESVQPQCLHSYIVTKKGANKILNLNYKINLPIDNYYSYLISKKIINSISFKDTLINQPWQEKEDTLKFGSSTREIPYGESFKL